MASIGEAASVEAGWLAVGVSVLAVLLSARVEGELEMFGRLAAETGFVSGL
jgi:hypothetical protein